MANTTTRPGADRRPLISYLRVQRERDREMIAVLTKAAEAINYELSTLSGTGIGAAVRREQLAGNLAHIHREVANLWRNIGRITLAGRADAAAVAVESMIPMGYLRRVVPEADAEFLLRAFQEQARATIETVEARLTLSRIPLSERVYRSEKLASGKIDDIVNAALARGASAAELAKSVRAFILPDTQGGARYAAMRLGRTEINNAFHAQQVKSGIQMPWVTGMKWNLSGSHPKPDECNEYADSVHSIGGEAGVYEPEQVPPKPHPNCLCYMTPVTVDRDQFFSDFESGKYDGVVDEIIAKGSITIR